MRRVEVVPYTKQWKKLFEDESEKIKEVFGQELWNIYHIGSTAIPYIHAKPIIDILVEVKQIKIVDRFNNKMEQLGYDVRGENGVANRRYFSKGGTNRTHHVHIFEKGNKEIARHLLFRDFMVAHPKEAQEYSQLKRNLAMAFPTDMENYIKGKHDYIIEIDERASKWAGE